MSHASVYALHQSHQLVGPEVIAEIIRALSGLHYGAVEIVVHGGNVTQIERREKVRIQPDTAARSAD